MADANTVVGLVRVYWWPILFCDGQDLVGPRSPYPSASILDLGSACPLTRELGVNYELCWVVPQKLRHVGVFVFDGSLAVLEEAAILATMLP